MRGLASAVRVSASAMSVQVSVFGLVSGLAVRASAGRGGAAAARVTVMAATVVMATAPPRWREPPWDTRPEAILTPDMVADIRTAMAIRQATDIPTATGLRTGTDLRTGTAGSTATPRRATTAAAVPASNVGQTSVSERDLPVIALASLCVPETKIDRIGGATRVLCGNEGRRRPEIEAAWRERSSCREGDVRASSA